MVLIEKKCKESSFSLKHWQWFDGSGLVGNLFDFLCKKWVFFLSFSGERRLLFDFFFKGGNFEDVYF